MSCEALANNVLAAVRTGHEKCQLQYFEKCHTLDEPILNPVSVIVTVAVPCTRTCVAALQSARVPVMVHAPLTVVGSTYAARWGIGAPFVLRWN